MRETIAELEAILADETVRSVIKDELLAIKEEFATPAGPGSPSTPATWRIEDLIDDEELIVTMTKGLRQDGRRRPFRTQGRGGRRRRRQAPATTTSPT